MSMMGTSAGEGWVGKPDRVFDLKGARKGSFSQNSTYMCFPAATDVKLAPPDRAAPLAVAVLLAVGVELHP
jgi:hypothetical protein